MLGWSRCFEERGSGAAGNHLPLGSVVDGDVIDVSLPAAVSLVCEAWNLDDTKPHLLEGHPHVHVIHEEEGDMSGYCKHLLKDGHSPDIGEPVTVWWIQLFGVILSRNIPEINQSVSQSSNHIAG